MAASNFFVYSCRGALRDLLCRPDLDDLAAIHHRDSRRQIAHYRHGVRDEQVGQAEIALKVFQQIHDLGADADVERRDWFVGDDELGAQSQRACDSDALPLASAEFVRIAPQRRLFQPDGFHQLGSVATVARAAALGSGPTVSSRPVEPS